MHIIRISCILMFVFSSMLIPTQLCGQGKPVKPQVGKAMPAFTLEKVQYFKKENVSLSDFKGKWLFLDFWHAQCVTCIQSFPKINSIQKAFKHRLTWLMVGVNDQRHGKGIEQFYEKLKNKMNLEIPVAFDSVLSTLWDIKSMPQIYVIDPSGMLYAITGGRDITNEKIGQLLDGEQVKFFPKDILRPQFNALTTSGLNHSSGNSVLYSSVLTKWNGEESYPGYDIDYYVDQKVFLIDKYKGYNLVMVPLYALYNYAYLGYWTWDFQHSSLHGKMYPKPLLLLEDSSAFEFDNAGRGTYNYNLIIPTAEISKERLMACMQEDLKRFFKFDASVETRNMPVWKLTAKPEVAKALVTKGGDRYFTPGTHAVGYTMRNVPVKYLIGSLSFYIQEKFDEPFVDETGLVGNIDFSIDADMTNIIDIKRALQKQGLDLVKGKKKMNAIVIRDRYQSQQPK